MTDSMIDINGNPLGLVSATNEIVRQFQMVLQPMPLLTSAPVNVPAEFSIPGFKSDDQGQRNFCHAHASTSVAEGCHYLATHRLRQFSRRFAGILNMRRDGSDASDRGASIESSAMVLKETGSAPEELLAYFSAGERYTNHIPKQCFVAADDFKCGGVFRARSYDEFDRGVALAGLGFGLFGTDWSDRWANVRTEQFGKEVLGGGGGHALSNVRWKTFGGERWYGVDNSHSGWGIDGKMFAFASPSLIDWLCRNSIYGVFVVSDMKVERDAPVKPRNWDWLKDANFSSGGVQL